MKKEYVKPGFEQINFSLEDGIAASTSCAIRVSSHDWETCAINVLGMGTVFGGPYGVDCEYEGDEANLCYFTAVPNMNVFGS